MLSIDIDEEGLALVRIDQPGRSIAVLDWPLIEAIAGMAERLGADPSVKGVILTARGQDFVAGADLGIITPLTDPQLTHAAVIAAIRRASDAFRQIERIGKPVVAAAPGTALGGGLELMLATHYRIAADNPRARFGLPEVGLGILPAAGGTQRLPRLIGLEAALPLLTRGTRLSVREAVAVGILDEVVPSDDLIPAARRALAEGRVPDRAPWDHPGVRTTGSGSAIAGTLDDVAKALAEDPGPCYPAPGAILDCLREGLSLPIDAALAVEWRHFARLVTGPVAPALIRLRFLARQRAARRGWKGADPQSPAALACRRGVNAETVRLRAAGVSPARINAAARAAGFTWLPVDGVEAGASDDEAALFGRRLILAGALAVAGLEPADPEIADLEAVEGAGFPAWTGGPMALMDREGREAIDAEARAAGIIDAPAPFGLCG